MEIISYIMLKLARIIPLGFMLVIIHMIFKQDQSNQKDVYIKEYGIDIDATIIKVFLYKNQEGRNEVIALVTVKYIFDEETIISKRRLRFCIADKDKLAPGQPIRIRVDPVRSFIFYYIDYENERL